MNGITERVERGAALLDEKRPGWLDLIDLDRLSIASACRCVLGQIGGYLTELTSLGIREGPCGDVSHGFDGQTLSEMSALTKAWRDLITRRREMGGVSS